MTEMVPLEAVLLKFKINPKLIRGKTVTEKNGKVWRQLIDPESKEIESSILESTLKLEMYPCLKATFAKKIYTQCELEAMNTTELQQAFNEKLRLKRENANTEQRQQQHDAEQMRISRNTVRMQRSGRSPIPIKSPNLN